MPFIYPKLPPKPKIVKKVTIRSNIGRRFANDSEIVKKITSGGQTYISTQTYKKSPSGVIQRASSIRPVYGSPKSSGSCPNCGQKGRNVFCPTCSI